MVEDVKGVKLGSVSDLECYLFEQADTTLQNLGDFWRDDVVCRPALRSSYLSIRTSKKFMGKCIDALALVHAKIVRNYKGQPENIIDLLIESPCIRFDTKV